MKILLAGYNIDYDLICELKNKSAFDQDLTPETISAAYARISRSPKTVVDLRQDARTQVDKARKSNQNIVFDMGHSSVAEHAVFNIDVIGVSRFLVEEIEKFRLCSFTEKSQRYVLFDRDFVIPEEIRDAGMTAAFVETIEMQNDFYHHLYEVLRPYVFEKHADLAADSANRSLLEGWAKEDARYAISLATETQLGMTINARNLELMLRRLSSMPLAEARRYAELVYKATKNIAPSLIRYAEATAYDRLTRQNLKKCADGILSAPASVKTVKKTPELLLVGATPKADLKTAASLLFYSSTLPFSLCLKRVARLNPIELKKLFKTALEKARSYDAVLREFENVALQFEMTVSASCFAQLKRHRMATLIAQDYDPRLGVTIPASVRAVGRRREFLQVIAKTNDLYAKIHRKNPAAAAYVLTNAHRRRVLMKLNAREMYHVARLRSDTHAQWDIRRLSDGMLKEARRAMPLTMMMACGKDKFPSLFEKTFQRLSKSTDV
jgi:flavin-dependent thymidylate synthase